jgi:hypothetical protein
MAYARGEANSLGWRNLIERPDEAHIGHQFPACLLYTSDAADD